jgi:beta-xylosidase
MSTSNIERSRTTYTNPVYEGYFADPFVWRHGGQYYAVGTGPTEIAGQVDEVGQERVFPVLGSSDLATWRYLTRALARPAPALGDSYWAPEVAEHQGTFYLYYSVGHEDRHHQLRVATSRHPAGPYEDVGEPLLDPRVTPFAIDPHPFRDDDGQWYLFYARDFLDGDSAAAPGAVRAGTALVVRRLHQMIRLDPAEGETVILRARHDWQRFLADRSMSMYGHARTFDWHTLEGPCVRKHKGRYYCFYSGGHWKSDSYGVDYGVADQVLGPYTDEGSAAGPRVLRSVDGRALGPGHNSFFLGPDGVTTYLAYHAWDVDMTARRMCIDRLIWTPAGPRCEGPTFTPQVVADPDPDPARRRSRQEEWER